MMLLPFISQQNQIFKFQSFCWEWIILVVWILIESSIWVFSEGIRDSIISISSQDISLIEESFKPCYLKISVTEDRLLNNNISADTLLLDRAMEFEILIKYIGAGNQILMHRSTATTILAPNHTILCVNLNMTADLQGSCQCPLHLYNTVFLRLLYHLMLSLQNIILTLTILLNFSFVTMENLNINDIPTTGGRNHVDPATLSADELLELRLVGSLLTDKPVKFTAMRDCFVNHWRPGQNITVSAIEENKFLFQFYHLWDMERVVQGGPWLFNSHMLVLKKLTIGDEPLAVKLDEAEMWVQIYNLPFGYINEPMGLLIGSHIGRYITYDAYSNSGPWRMYMRIRVAVKVDEPLKKSLTFEKADGGIIHVHFKYENSIGGGVTINKWLRDGKGQSSGGRGGSNGANIGTTDRRTTMDAAAVGVNVGQPVQHARFGRVKVIRDVRGKGFIFQTATSNPMHHVAAYDGEV
ncbi:hypothetical protein QL285_034177 [Trifolium repens]|nr:hypothetical protein QL285_034177 [Trifolium repens]